MEEMVAHFMEAESEGSFAPRIPRAWLMDRGNGDHTKANLHSGPSCEC